MLYNLYPREINVMLCYVITCIYNIKAMRQCAISFRWLSDETFGVTWLTDETTVAYGFILQFSGIVKDVYGSYDPMFYTAIASSLYMCVACVIVIILMKRQKRCEETQKLIQKTEPQYDSVKYSKLKDDSNSWSTEKIN